MRAESDRAPGEVDRSVDPSVLGGCSVWKALSHSSCPVKGPLTGDHLIAAGMKPGPEFKPILAEALAAQDDGVFEDEAGALRWFGSHQSQS